MTWMRERDLLIAQTMAFVQSVSGKNPDNGSMIGPEVIEPESSRPTLAAAPIAEIEAVLRALTLTIQAQSPQARSAIQRCQGFFH